MYLPTKQVQEDYLKAQIDAIERKLFLYEMNNDFDKARLTLAEGVEEKREIEDAISNNELGIEGSKEYLAVLHEMIGYDTVFPVEEQMDILAKKLLEVEKANFRGVVAEKLQQSRKPESKEDKRAVEDELEAISNSIKANDIIYDLAKAKLDELS